MESITTMQLAARSRAGYQDPSVNLGIRCVQGDLLPTRGEVRPLTGATAGFPVRIRPATPVFVAPQGKGSVPPGGHRYET